MAFPSFRPGFIRSRAQNAAIHAAEGKRPSVGSTPQTPVNAPGSSVPSPQLDSLVKRPPLLSEIHIKHYHPGTALSSFQGPSFTPPGDSTQPPAPPTGTMAPNLQSGYARGGVVSDDDQNDKIAKYAELVRQMDTLSSYEDTQDDPKEKEFSPEEEIKYQMRDKLDGDGKASGGKISGTPPSNPGQDNKMVPMRSGEYVIPEPVVKAKGKDFFDNIVKSVTGSPPPSGPKTGFADGGTGISIEPPELDQNMPDPEGYYGKNGLPRDAYQKHPNDTGVGYPNKTVHNWAGSPFGFYGGTAHHPATYYNPFTDKQGRYEAKQRMAHGYHENIFMQNDPNGSSAPYNPNGPGTPGPGNINPVVFPNETGMPNNPAWPGANPNSTNPQDFSPQYEPWTLGNTYQPNTDMWGFDQNLTQDFSPYEGGATQPEYGGSGGGIQ